MKRRLFRRKYELLKWRYRDVRILLEEISELIIEYRCDGYIPAGTNDIQKMLANGSNIVVGSDGAKIEITSGILFGKIID